MGGSEVASQLDGAQWSRSIEGNFDPVTSNMIACAHLPTKLSGPILYVPFQALSRDIRSS